MDIKKRPVFRVVIKDLITKETKTITVYGDEKKTNDFDSFLLELTDKIKELK